MRAQGSLICSLAFLIAGVCTLATENQVGTPGAISGVVVDGGSGAPVGEAVVSISAVSSERAPALRLQQTDSKGRFVFRDLATASRYVVTAEKSGYFAGQHGSPEPFGPSQQIVLNPGEWFGDARIVLWRPAAVAGLVLDERNDPIVGAYVRAIGEVQIAGVTKLVAGPLARTDDRGAYRITNLRRGRYFVLFPSVQTTVPASMSQAHLNNRSTEVVSRYREPLPPRVGLALAGDAARMLALGPSVTPPPSPDGRTQTYSTMYFPDARIPADASAIALDFGEERQNVDLHLRPAPAFQLSGTMVGPKDAFSNLTLRLIATGAEGLGSGTEIATTRVDADGEFKFHNVAAGAYTIDATASLTEFTSEVLFKGPMNLQTLPPPPGLAAGGQLTSVSGASLPGTMFTLLMGSSAQYWGRARVTLQDQNLQNVSITLQRGITISGALVGEPGADSPAGRTAALLAEPFPGNEPLVFQNTIVAEGTDGSDVWKAPRRFDIAGLTPGRYFLRTKGQGDALVKSALLNGRDYASAPLDLSTGQDITGLVLTVTTRLAKIEGVVRDAQNITANSAAVICFPVDPQQRTFALTPRGIASVLTDSKGAYRIDGLPGGEYYVVAVPVRRYLAWQGPGFFDSASRDAVRVTVGWGASARQPLVVGDIK